MAASDLHEAISLTLQKVATAVRADRMLVSEIVPNAPAPRQ
jgi:hypothetical protein